MKSVRMFRDGVQPGIAVVHGILGAVFAAGMVRARRRGGRRSMVRYSAWAGPAALVLFPVSARLVRRPRIPDAPGE